MGAMASQITRWTIVYSVVWSKKTSNKFRVTGLFVEKSPVTGESSIQKISNVEMSPFDDVIMHHRGSETASEL